MSNLSRKKTTDSLADVPPSILSKIKTQYAKLTELERTDKAALKHAADLASVIQQVVEDYGCKVAPLAKACGLDEREAQRLMKLPISSVLGEIKKGELAGADYRYPRWRSFVIENKTGGMKAAAGARGGKGKAASEPTEPIAHHNTEGFELQRIVDADPEEIFQYLCHENNLWDFMPYLADYIGCEEKQLDSLGDIKEDVTMEDVMRWYPDQVAELVANPASGGKGNAATTEPTERIDDWETEGFELQRIVDADPQEIFRYLCCYHGFSNFIPYLADFINAEQFAELSAQIEARNLNETIEEYLGRPWNEVKELMDVLRDTTVTAWDLAGMIDRDNEAAALGAGQKTWNELEDDNTAQRDRIEELETENAELQERLKNSRHGPYSRGNQEVGTPVEISDQVKQEFGNDIQDVAASDELHISDDYLTIKEDGLTAKWKKIAYCCPSFGDIGTWMYRGLEHWMNDGTFIALVPLHCDSNTDWFWDVAVHGEIRLLGRVAFKGYDTAVAFPCIMVVLQGESKFKDGKLCVVRGNYEKPKKARKSKED